MDFSGVLASVQRWIGTEVSASGSIAGAEYVRATGVIGKPELLLSEDDDGGEYWIFPLVGNTGSFALPRAAFIDARWAIPEIRLQVELTGAMLEIELA